MGAGTSTSPSTSGARRSSAGCGRHCAPSPTARPSATASWPGGWATPGVPRRRSGQRTQPGGRHRALPPGHRRRRRSRRLRRGGGTQDPPPRPRACPPVGRLARGPPVPGPARSVGTDGARRRRRGLVRGGGGRRRGRRPRLAPGRGQHRVRDVRAVDRPPTALPGRRARPHGAGRTGSRRGGRPVRGGRRHRGCRGAVVPRSGPPLGRGPAGAGRRGGRPPSRDPLAGRRPARSRPRPGRPGGRPGGTVPGPRLRTGAGVRLCAGTGRCVLR